MRQIRRALFALLMSCLPLPVLAQAVVPPQPLSVDGAVTHVYKVAGRAELRLHVFGPPNHSTTTKSPAIVFFFGGGWANGNIAQFAPQSRHLAARGMVAIVADYRVSGRHQTSPFEAMADARSAIRWVRARAKDLGIDSDRIVAGGGSAGGHIALSAAVIGGVDEGEDSRVSAKPNTRVEDGKWYGETLLEADRFLTSLGYLPKPAATRISQ